MPAAFIINPESGRVKRKGSVLESVSSDQVILKTFLTDFDQINAVVQTSAEQNIDHIFIEGGDGTAQGVLTAFLRAQDNFKAIPKFTVLFGGMTNQIAKNIGLKKATSDKVISLLKNSDKSIQDLPLLQLNIKGAPTQYGFLFSSGAVPIATDFAKDKMHGSGVTGSMAVFGTLIRGIGGSRAARDKFMPPTPLSLRITGNKEETHLDQDHLGTLVTTLPGLILNIDPFWGSGDAPLRLTYAGGNARAMPMNMIGLWSGRKHVDRTKDGYESFTADVLRYDYTGPVVLDGEPLELPENQIEIRATHPIKFVK